MRLHMHVWIKYSRIRKIFSTRMRAWYKKDWQRCFEMALAMTARSSARVEKSRRLACLCTEKILFRTAFLIWVFVVCAFAFLCVLIIYANNTLHFLS